MARHAAGGTDAHADANGDGDPDSDAARDADRGDHAGADARPGRRANAVGTRKEQNRGQLLIVPCFF